MKEQNKTVSWTPFSDNLKNNRTIVDNELEKSNSGIPGTQELWCPHNSHWEPKRN